jgi:hypothetical protein
MDYTDIKTWEAQSEEEKLLYLRGFFRIGYVKRANRAELEDFLVLLAITPFTDNPLAKETERYATIVQHFWQVRVSEEFHWRSMSITVAALVISCLSFALSAYLALHKGVHSDTEPSGQTQTNTAIIATPPRK